MQTTASLVPQYCFWLMIVSIATAVLPVLRSPMISSRLALADRDHRVDGLDAGLHRLGDGLTLGDAGGDDVDLAELRGVDRAQAVDRAAERIDDAAEHGLADGHFEQAAGGLDHVAFLDGLVIAVDDRRRCLLRG